MATIAPPPLTHAGDSPKGEKYAIDERRGPNLAAWADFASACGYRSPRFVGIDLRAPAIYAVAVEKSADSSACGNRRAEVRQGACASPPRSVGD